jgi:hypothetical protein
MSREEIARRIQELMDAKEERRKHKKWLATAVKVPVHNHPNYKEYVKMANCGVDDSTLQALMEAESTEEKELDFNLLRDPFQLIELKPPRNLDSDSEDDTKSVDEDGSVVSDKNSLSPVSGKQNEVDGETKEEPHHHRVKVLSKEEEAKRILAEFDERSESDDEFESSSSEEEDFSDEDDEE